MTFPRTAAGMNVLALVPLAALVELCWGGRVLVVFPVPSRVHSVLGDSVVRTLLDGGHEVTYVTAAGRAAGGASARLRLVDISCDVTDETLYNTADPSVSYPLQRGVTIAEKALQHEAMQHLLRDPTESFDLVIADWFYSGLLAPLALLYDCPLIWYSSSDLHWQSLRLMHEASSPAYTVDQNSRGLSGEPFTTWERAYQLWLQVYLSAWSYYLTNYVETPAYRRYYGHALGVRGRSVPEFESLVYNASMMLVNSHPPVGQVIPLPHNVKYIGGHHVELPVKPLPADLKRVLDNAKNGVILFSLESEVKGRLPDVIKHEIVQLFRRLEQTVVWSTEEHVEDLPRNLHVLRETPRISILNHPNTLTLITHGDMVSITEAAHCGVPVIGVPVSGDQFVSVDLAAARGWAVRVELTTHLAITLNEAINEIIGDFSYRSSAKRVSALFRRRSTPAHAELLHWVQLVLDTKGAPYLRSPALRLPAAERLYLDIVIVAAAVAWFLSKVLKVINAHLRDEDFDRKNR